MTAEISLGKRSLLIANVVFHQLVAVVTVYILTVIFSNWDINSYMTWHAALASLGFVFCMAEGLMVFSSDNICTLYLKRSVKSTIHGVILSLGVLSITAGVSLEIQSKNENSYKHFQSSHAILGLVAWICTLLAALGGILADNAKRFPRPLYVKLCHTVAGLLAFTLGIANVGLGVYKSNFKSFTHEDVLVAAVVALALMAFWAMVESIMTTIRLIKNIVD